MKNKEVIRKDKKEGTFTLIHNSILLDTRLSSTAFRLLTLVLSDSDTKFNLSQTVYCDRLGVTKPTYLKAISNLEECGYLRKSINKINKNLHFYTISEFGNLKPKENNQPLENIVKTENTLEVEKPLFQLEDFFYLFQNEISKRKNQKINLEDLFEYLCTEMESGKLNCSSQITPEYIDNIVNMFIIIKPINVVLTIDNVKQLCEKHKHKVLKNKYSEFVEFCLSTYQTIIKKGESLDRFSGTILGISNQQKFKKKEKVDYETFLSEREND